ncbi:unnamed protein product [Polarella glacialis]|uniref:Uncharacterized protein n=1 Tax=Polarella glacialis TaxID=89957 RepID=A0A813LCA3_POLGL|nr:unnamed protein product [Polarella glacialis]
MVPGTCRRLRSRPRPATGLAASVFAAQLMASSSSSSSSSSARNCSLSSLDIWSDGARLGLEPAFSAEVLQYRARPLDFEASDLWVDPKPARGCVARRSDARRRSRLT